MDGLFFGVSCAFAALKLLPEPEECDDERWAGIRTRLMKGTAHLLGLLIWKARTEEAQTGTPKLLRELERAEKQIEQLKQVRSQDGKANERVVAIVAAREQIYLDERRKLRQQIEESGERLGEMEEDLRESENLARELRQHHAREMSKHKAAFVELVSNQRQLEAEMGRALRQLESAKRELESAQRMSMEVAKLRRDLEQKDQVLSAMLRKSKLDSSEKEVLLKEVKRSAKAMRKQAEMETKGRRAGPGTRSERTHSSLRNMLSKHVNGKSDVFSGGKGHDVLSLASEQYSSDDGSNEQKISPHAEHLENWITSEASTYKIAIDQRHKHNLEIDAFAEQLRLKDENLESLRWRLLSMDIESKRLHSHIESLDHEITNLKHENMKLEAQLTDRESELHSLKEQLVLQFNPPNLQKLQFSPSSHEVDVNHETVWSKVKVIKRKPGQKMEEEKMNEITENEQPKDIVLTLQYPLQKEKSVGSGDLIIRQGSSKEGNSTMKMDIQALGVLYKIKRLKQQFLMLERMTGKQESSEDGESENGLFGIKGLYALISLLNRQADRYQSLHEKTDDLCQRMHETNLNLNCRGATIAKTPDETKQMEQFLDETFQLQRYMVATGQKLTEVQARVASGFVVDAEKTETPPGFDVKRFADSIRTMFQEVQRGLEIRISRIIGDLEGTLACDGIIHFKKQF